MSWEIVHEKKNGTKVTERLRVPGGWLYHVIISLEDRPHFTSSTCFVPDPKASEPAPEEPAKPFDRLLAHAWQRCGPECEWCTREERK